MYDDVVVIGKMSAEERAQKLMEVGDLAEPGEDMDDNTLQTGLQLRKLLEEAIVSAGARPWEHTSHVVGFLEPGAGGADLIAVRDAASVAPDPELAGARVDVTLDRLRVAAYPGRGGHRILLAFQARSHWQGGAAAVHFTVLVRAREGESAAVVGAPVFVGLGVGEAGPSLRLTTVNVKNEDDDALLAALESDAMKGGLQLLPTAQPAARVASCLSAALTRSLARRHRNVAVQDVAIGLDLGGAATAARLRAGTYFAVQAPAGAAPACWDDWAYHRLSGLLVKRDAPSKPIPYNYVALGVRRHAG